MWWYNILRDNKESISHLLWFDPITSGYILLTDNLVALKKGNSEPFLVMKRTEWRKIIGYFGLSIEADPSRVGKQIFSLHIGYIARHSSLNINISRHRMGKYINL